MPRKQHTHHYIYKVTCIVTSKYYIGMHSTSNLEDGYFGSGKRLRYSISKYGKENHSIEILDWLPDRSSLKLREEELVNESLLSDPLCMNLQLGGGGGFIGETHKSNWIKAGSIAGNKKLKELYTDPAFVKSKTDKFKRTISDPVVMSRMLSGFAKYRGSKHTAETKSKISLANSISQLGSGNSQFGSCWITNETENKKIKKTDPLPEGWRYGRKIN